jgi:hypothetical protein
MTKQTTKTILIKDIHIEHQRLDTYLARLSQEEMQVDGVVGTWSVKDLLAHLTAWEQLLIGWYQAGLHNEPMDPSPVGMSRLAMDQLNQHIYERHKDTPLSQIWDEYQTSYQQILTMLEPITEEDLFTHQRFPWTGRWTLADYVAGNTCNHYRWAKSRLRGWMLKRQEL